MNPSTNSKPCQIHKKNIVTSFLQARVIALESFVEESKIRFSKHDDQLGKLSHLVRVNKIELANEQKSTRKNLSEMKIFLKQLLDKVDAVGDKIEASRKESADKTDAIGKDLAEKIEAARKESAVKTDAAHKELLDKIEAARNKVDAVGKDLADKIEAARKESTGKTDAARKKILDKIEAGVIFVLNEIYA
jgi:hypothetical protein